MNSTFTETAATSQHIIKKTDPQRRQIPLRENGSMRRHGSEILFFAIFWISLPPVSVFSQKAHQGIQLPHASGRYGVARVGYDWVDRARPETYAQDSTARREIMVYVWYPTVRGSGSRVLSEYLPHADAIAKTLNDVPGKIEEFWGESWVSIFSGTVLGETYEQAPISPGTERFPVLIFAPGFATPSTSYTTLIEEVVSQGFIVASIEPTYDVAAVAFPDGRIIPFRAQWQPGAEPPPSGETWQQFLDRLHAFDVPHVETWSADIRFVIDQLSALEKRGKEVAPFAGRTDLQNIGTWGHSLGGRAAVRACQLDSRAKACLDADGAAAEGASLLPTQPFMWIDVYHEPATEAQLAVHKITQKEWENYHRTRLEATEKRMHDCLGDCYHLSIRVPGTDHYSFSDSPLLSAASRKDFDAAVHALQPLEAYTIAFFDKYLKHMDVPLLDRPNIAVSGITLERTGKHAE
jgi:hypothetical protein